MKIIFREGTPDMKYQRFAEYRYGMKTLNNRLESEMTNELIDVIVKSFLFNEIYDDESVPYRFQGFYFKHNRNVYPNDTIIFYFRPLNKVTKIFHGDWVSVDYYHDTLSIFAELNWELV